jgi:hypothetical protein
MRGLMPTNRDGFIEGQGMAMVSPQSPSPTKKNLGVKKKKKKIISHGPAPKKFIYLGPSSSNFLNPSLPTNNDRTLICLK